MKEICVDVEKMKRIVLDIEANRKKTLCDVYVDRDKCSETLGCWNSVSKKMFEEVHAFLVEDAALEYERIEDCMILMADMLVARDEIDIDGMDGVKQAKILY